jgi:hypothetical protein
VIVGATLAVIAFSLSVLLLPPELYFPVLHALRLSVSVVVVLTFARVLPGILVQRPLDAGSQLILGILCVWVAEIAISAWSLTWRLSDQSWMLNSPILAGLLYLKVVGGTLHVTAPRAVDGRVPRRSWVMLVIGASVAALLAGIIIGARWGNILLLYL